MPPHVTPPRAPLGRLAFLRAFVRNPLEAIPRAVYEEEAHAAGGRLWVSSPSLVRTVLLDERHKFQKVAQMRLLSPLLGRGILTSEGAEWKWQRQAAAPMFRPQDLHGFVPTFTRTAQEVVARWRAAPPGAVQRVDLDMSRVTFQVISATLLPSADADAFERSIALFQRSGGWGQLYASLKVPRWVPHPGILAAKQAVELMRSTVGDMVRLRCEAEHRGAPVPDDLMHRLIAARDPETGQSMNDEQLIDNLLTFYLAGHDTTAKGLTWALYLLARSPHWAAACEEEVARITRNAPVAPEHIEGLALVRQVLKEAMRLYPPVPMMGRQAVAEAKIGGHVVPAGASVLMPIYAIHRHAARWEDPDAFDPSRFSTEREAKMPRYQYMPFGAGPRICIGMSFAMLEATAILATLLQHARFETVAGHEPKPIARVTLNPSGGMPLKVTFRA